MALSLLRYLVFVVLAIVGPGVAVQRLAGLAVDAAVVLPLGCALTAGAFALGSWLGLPWLLPATVLVLDATLVWRGLGRRAAGDPSLRGALPAAAALLLMLALTSYGWNVSGPQGQFEMDPMGDHPLHVGITWELALPWPPQVPGLAGFPLHYQLGSDLLRAAALRFAGVSPYDALNRFQVTLGALALALLVRAVSVRLGAGPAAARLAPFTLLATDFSYWLAFVLPISWWSDLLRGNLLLSLSFDNPVVLGLAMALGALLCLARYEAGEGRGWLALAAVLAAATAPFKVFTAAQLALGLAWATLRGPQRGARALLTGLSLGALALHVVGSGGERVEVAFAPLELVRQSLGSLGLGQPSGAALLAWLLPWLALSLGLRVLGVAGAFAALFHRGGLAASLGAVALSGWPLALLFHVAARDLQGERLHNAVIYLTEQSGCVLWIFTAIAVAELGRRWVRPVLVTAVAAALALPATVEFVGRRLAMPSDELSPALVGGLTALRAASRPGDIVLQRPGWERPPLPVLLAGRRVVLEGYTPYLTQFAPARELRHRRGLLVQFFRSEDSRQARRMASDLGASFLCLYGTQALAFDGRDWLHPIYSHQEIRVFRIDRDEALAPD